MKRIHWSKLWELMERKDDRGKPIPFSIVFVKRKTGEIRKKMNCTCTSVHAIGPTVNILYAGEVEPRSIRKCLIIEFNNMSVYQ